MEGSGGCERVPIHLCFPVFLWFMYILIISVRVKLDNSSIALKINESDYVQL